jgi:hypothetical protein
MTYKVKFYDVLADKPFTLETAADSREDAGRQGQGWAEMAGEYLNAKIEFRGVVESVE